MIYTVTCNPAADVTVTVPGFEKGKVNRAEHGRTDPGGKGINVSKNLAAMGMESKALGLVGGAAGRSIAEALEKMGIATDFTPISGTTRTNTKLVDPRSGETTDVNLPGPAVTPEEIAALEEKLKASVHGGDTVIFSGSLPAGAPEDTYARLIHTVRSKGAKTYLDASGAPLRAALEARPYLLKPNVEELQSLVEQKLETAQDVIRAARTVSLPISAAIVVSMGGDGAIMVKNGIAYFAKAPHVNVLSTVGAGDAMVAALAAGEAMGLEDRDLLAFAVAAGSAAVAQPGSAAVDMSDVLYLTEQVQCAGVMG